jgi:hypothetical protein
LRFFDYEDYIHESEVKRTSHLNSKSKFGHAEMQDLLLGEKTAD